MAFTPKKIHIAIVAIILLVLVAALAFTSFTENPVPPGGATGTPTPSVPVTPTTGAGTAIATPIGPGSIPTTLSTPVITVATTPEPLTSVTVPPTLTPTTNTIPPSFSIAVTPVAASAQRGETITYTLDISPEGNFQAPIKLDLTVTALFFHQVYDLGTQYPPYPKRILYDFQVPGYIPPGTNLVGVMRAEGNGVVREEGLSLYVF